MALPPLVLHVNPMGRQETDFHLWPVASLALVVDPATGRGESTIRSHVKHMFAKHGLPRQADLVLSLASVPESRR